MKYYIKLNQQEMDEHLSVFQKTETPGRLTVKLNREISGLSITIDGTENEIEKYLNLLCENGFSI